MTAKLITLCALLVCANAISMPSFEGVTEASSDIKHELNVMYNMATFVCEGKVTHVEEKVLQEVHER